MKKYVKVILPLTLKLILVLICPFYHDQLNQQRILLRLCLSNSISNKVCDNDMILNLSLLKVTLESFIKINIITMSWFKSFLPDTCLSSQVPNLKLKIFIRNLFDIEAYSWYGCHHFSDLYIKRMKVVIEYLYVTTFQRNMRWRN